MGLLARLLGLGDGRPKPELRAALEGGAVLIEEGLRGSLRYHRLRAPGLLVSPFSNPNLEAVEIEAEGDRLDLLVDYDRLEVPKVSGQTRIQVRPSKAALIATTLSTLARNNPHSETPPVHL